MTAAVLTLAYTNRAEAHVLDGPVGERWWLAWNHDPLLLFALIAAGALYAAGLRRIWHRTDTGRGVGRAQAAAFAGGMLALVLALVSPIDALSAELSSVHMGQHMILMMIAAPLLILGAPIIVMLWALPLRWRQTFGNWQKRLEAWQPARYVLWQPLVLWLIYAFTLWVWHLPALYEAALANQYLHDLQHLAFLLASCLFWRVLLDPISRLRMSAAAGVIYLFTTCLHASALGIFMAFSPRLWYPAYATTAPGWGLTPLEDQQLAGMIMWIPACLIYAIVAAAILAIWLHDPAEEAEGGA